MKKVLILVGEQFHHFPAFVTFFKMKTDQTGQCTIWEDIRDVTFSLKVVEISQTITCKPQPRGDT